MVNGCANTALRQVARVFHEGTLTSLSDRQMLERFIDCRDEAAFDVLVARHGPMVFNVCRHTLRDLHDVEDAYQAVFLVLVRKASTIRIEGSLGPWLYSVAHRVAARARANRRRTGTRETAATMDFAESRPENSLERLEAAAVIQEELARLPARLRAPLVLCYLQGMTHELAASQLGCPVGTVRSRLSRGRAQLLTRVMRRGLTLSAAGLVTALESTASAAGISATIRVTLIKLATEFVSDTTATVGGLGASASVAALLEGVLNVMRIKKLAIMAVGLVGLSALGFVIADRAAAVGGSPRQEPVPESQGPIIRTPGPDGKVMGSASVKPQHEAVVQTYYVGDILRVTQPPRPGTTNAANTKQPAIGEVRPIVDMKPLIHLIASTVAPGTWQLDDRDAQAMTANTNYITPFFLSVSLIVRCKPEVHAQVANLLRGLRVLIGTSDDESVQRSPGEPLKSPQASLWNDLAFPAPTTVPPPPVPSTTTLPAPPAQRQVPPAPASRRRALQLLDKLQQEIQKLPQDPE